MVSLRAMSMYWIYYLNTGSLHKKQDGVHLSRIQRALNMGLPFSDRTKSLVTEWLLDIYGPTDHSVTGIFVRYSGHHSVNGPFGYWTTMGHLVTGRV